MTYVLGVKPPVVVALESSRTLARAPAERAHGKFQALEARPFPAKGALTLYLRAVKQAVPVVKQVFPNTDGRQDSLALVSSATHLDYEQMTTS